MEDRDYPFAGETQLYALTLDQDYDEPVYKRQMTDDIEQASASTSLIKATAPYADPWGFGELPPPRHHILIDLDVEAHLLPSSTPGHSHLYIRANTPWPNIVKLLDALVACGVVEEGYAEASKRRGHTTLRLPWVRKTDPSIQILEA